MKYRQIPTLPPLTLFLLLSLSGCPEPSEPVYRCESNEDCPGVLSCNLTSQRCVDDEGLCGDGIRQPFEECDFARSSDEFCAYGSPSCLTCNSSCQLVDAGRAPFCGDGTVQAEQEACDPGDDPDLFCPYGLSSCMVCTENCVRVPGQTSFCGDEDVDLSAGEECDAGTNPNQLCPYSQSTCTVCTAQCKTTAGITSTCGDGNVDTANGEECDEGPNPNQLCPYGEMSCTVCSATCKSRPGEISFCGDDTVDPGESCDPGPGEITLDCPYGEPDCTVCSAMCTLERGVSQGECGDGMVNDEFEQCDGTQGLEMQSCAMALGVSYGEISCDMTCQFDQDLCFGIVELAAGGQHTCGRTSTGRVYCWGNNLDGQLGIGSNVGSPEPTLIPILDEIISISAGSGHTCALDQSGDVYCWGNNSAGQLGIGSTINSNLPVQVAGVPAGARKVTVGNFHSCALLSSGEVYCWGDNRFGGLNVDNAMAQMQLTPIKTASTGYSDLDAGGIATCGLRNNAVVCWGQAFAAEMQVTWQSRQITGATNILSLSVGQEHGCAVTQDNKAICWGNNGMDQLGTSTMPSNVSTAVTVIESGQQLGNVVSIHAGGTHSCARTGNDEVLCWGANFGGQLGTGDLSGVNQPEPTQVSALQGRGTESLSLGTFHSCAFDGLGAVSCWGNNSDGEIGDGSTGISRFNPTTTTGWP